MAQALVPLKDLVQAKSRLAGLLSPSQRRILAQAMLEDVLTVLAAHPDIERIVLVSDDPAAHLLAAQYSAEHWPETELGCRGLNAVASTASARLLAGVPAPVLLVHADLPLLSAADISALLAARRDSAGLVVGCDRHGTGTNALCFDAASVPLFSFGADSCGRHLAAARTRGMPATRVCRAGIGLDVDEPGDLVVLLGQLDSMTAGHTTALIHRGGLGTRIEMALASPAPQDMPLDREEVR